MAINETKIVIKAKDEASPVFVDMQGKLKGLDNSFKEVSKSTSGFSNYMKEQKKEGREHKFVLGEIKDALGVVGLAMNLLGDSTGKGNEEFKKINDSVNKGIVAFYGLDAVVSTLSKTFKFLGGGVGLAITAIGAIALAVADYINQSKKVPEVLDKEITAHDRIIGRLKEAFNLYQNLANIKKLTADRDKIETENKIKQLQELIILDENLIKAIEYQLSQTNRINVAETLRLELRKEDLKTSIESKQGKIRLAEADLFAAKQTEKITQATIEAKNALKDSTKEAEENEKAFWKLTRQMNQLLSLVGVKKTTKLELVDKTQMAGVEAEIQAFKDRQAVELNEFAATTTAINGAIFQSLGDSMKFAFSGAEASGKAGMKSILNSVITTVEGLMVAAAAAGKAWGVITFGTSLVKDIILLTSGFALLETARGIVNRMHSGGQAFVNAPADREVPIMVRGQETIRVTTPEQERRSGSGGVVINFNSPVSDVQFVKSSILKVLRDTGLSVNQAFTNNRNKLSLA